MKKFNINFNLNFRLFYIIFVVVSVPYFIKISKGLYNNFIATNITFDLDTLL